MTTTLSSVPVRQCGKTDLKLPVLGMGCWAFGEGEYWGAQSQTDVDAVVHYAVDHGCNFFDTAEAYNKGSSETSLGLALKGIPREKVIVCTKISPSNTQPENVAKHCEASLRRLQLDYLDLYMVHWPITAHGIKHFVSEPIPTPSTQEAFAALDKLRRQGKIRHIGVSNFAPTKLNEVLATGVPITVNELPFSLLTRAVEREILPMCREKGIGVLGYMSLLQGVISDKYTNLDDLPPVRRRTRHFDNRKNPLARHRMAGVEAETQAALNSIRAIAKREGMSTSDLALKWAFAGDGITSSLCGSRNVEALKGNIQAALSPLSPALIAELNHVTQALLEALGPGFDYYEHPSLDRTV
jgi:aryl-alcohol dehydrogenase-like predicted oxidoreductase